MTGSEQIVPAQAAVIAFAFPFSSLHVINTAGTGFNMLLGFQYCLLIYVFPFYLNYFSIHNLISILWKIVSFIPSYNN